MPSTITVASVQQYKANVELLLQQEGSRLRGLVEQGSYVGKAASVVEQFGTATAQLKVSRHADTPLLALSQAKRWVFPLDYEWASLIDHEDKLRMIIDPTSPYARAGAASMHRAFDDEILGKMFGGNFVGENGTTADAWNTAYQVAASVGGSASGLNVAKLQAGIRLLMTAAAGELMEPVFGAIGAYEHDLLLKEMQIANRDYGNSAVLVDGKVKRFMGVDFTLTERLNVTGGNREVPIWVKSGVHFGVWNDLHAEVTQRADKSYATQVYLCATFGATRTQDGKIIKLICDDQI